MNDAKDLEQIMERIDHRGYPAYKDTAGAYQFLGYVLSIDRVQGDPFASPSDLSVHVSGHDAAFPKEFYDTPYRKTALEDVLLRQFSKEAARFSFAAKGSGKSGLLSVSRPGQEILSRSALRILPEGGIVLAFRVGFPANGRTINAGELKKILFDFLPQCIKRSLYCRSYPREALIGVINLADDQQYIRQQLKERHLAAFVADGAILPRQSGVSSQPMKGAVRFSSPDSLAVTMDLPHAGRMRGMGIAEGITMIAGGGYHGKSTLLSALQQGVYNHIAGDGREYVITDDTAVKLRAEDGRCICSTDISLFIKNLPNGQNTFSFCTEDASGSTSEAANAVEAMEAGARVFLIDEDTSATNFMIRDELMQRVISRDSEPIIPFIDRVRALYTDFGVSTILVAGSCGSYFYQADHIIQMKQYEALDITSFAKDTAAAFLGADEAAQKKETPALTPPVYDRKLTAAGRWDDRIKIRVSGTDGFSLDRESVDLRYLEQLADSEQTAMLAEVTRYALRYLLDGTHTMREILDAIEARLKEKGVAGVCGGRFLPCGYAMPRRQEIAACLNRLRLLRPQRKSG